MAQDSIADTIAENLAALRAQIAACCDRCGRDARAVFLLPATKYVGVPVMRALFALGVREFGENQVQDAERKAAALPPETVFHMIGHLQRNKVKKALACFRTIQSVDSLRLAEEIDRRAEGRAVPVLVEINTGGEAQKHGFAIADALPALDAMRPFGHLRIEGLMTVAPYAADPACARPCFARLRLLRDEARQRGLGDGRLETLSMGMSSDFETAIEEGATIVRVGSALFAGLGAPRDGG